MKATAKPFPGPPQVVFVSRRDAARMLSVSLSTVDALIAHGQLAAYKVARTVRLRLEDVLAQAVPRD